MPTHTGGGIYAWLLGGVGSLTSRAFCESLRMVLMTSSSGTIGVGRGKTYSKYTMVRTQASGKSVLERHQVSVGYTKRNMQYVSDKVRWLSAKDPHNHKSEREEVAQRRAAMQDRDFLPDHHGRVSRGQKIGTSYQKTKPF